MPQVESLTVQILGDSSGLQEELHSVADLIDSLVSELSAATEGVGAFGDSFGNLAAAVSPLQGVSNQLGLIIQQLQQISSQPLTLNVQPALDALATLIQSAQSAAMQLQALSAIPVGPAIGAGMPMMEATAMMGGLMEAAPRRLFASGGLVTGPSGIDQVPARLTAGEFVLNPDAVAQIGLNRLEDWNRGRLEDSQHEFIRPVRRVAPFPLWGRDGSPSSEEGGVSAVTRLAVNLPVPPSPDRIVPRLPMENSSLKGIDRPRFSADRLAQAGFGGPPVQQTTNHFGGIEIHVKEGGEISQILDDLRRQGIGIRHRRG
jgi:hypothetical protein